MLLPHFVFLVDEFLLHDACIIEIRAGVHCGGNELVSMPLLENCLLFRHAFINESAYVPLIYFLTDLMFCC